MNKIKRALFKYCRTKRSQFYLSSIFKTPQIKKLLQEYHNDHHWLLVSFACQPPSATADLTLKLETLRDQKYWVSFCYVCPAYSTVRVLFCYLSSCAAQQSECEVRTKAINAMQLI